MTKKEKLAMAAARLREIADNYPLTKDDKALLRMMAKRIEHAAR